MSSFAQDASNTYKGAGYDVLDSSLVPSRRMDQQRDFLNNQYDFPSRPRSQWEIGINGGLFNVSGDVRSKTPFNQPKNIGNTLGWGVTVRKAWGYIISTRLQFIKGKASGYNWQPSNGYADHGVTTPWTQNYGTGTAAKDVYYNYKTNISELSLELVAALNNVKFHKARNKASVYVLAGMGGMLYETMVDALDADKAAYKFTTIVNKAQAQPNWKNNYKGRKAVNTALLNMYDGTYETRAERHDNRPWTKGKEKTFRTILTAGLGVQFKLSRKVSLSIEDKWSYTNDDLVDGQRWQEWPQPGYGGAAMTRDYDNYNYASVGLNLALGGKSVEPLWWMNPLDYGYNAAKRQSPRGGACDTDADGDGVSDCFDRCADTPAGVAVDSHGCCLDTDGDGVCDYKDKQLITPTECQPVDADGVGKCPCPDCGGIAPVKGSCGDIKGGTVGFSAGSAKLSSGAMGQLSSLANAMRSNPTCNVVVIGNGNGSKMEQQRSWDRVNSVINYMVDKQGVDRERFIFQYGQSGDANSVEYRSAGNGEEGPSNTPPPFPNLRRN
jgi:hypothetical protein